MNKAIKQKWIRALESGKYRRGMGQLRQMEDGAFKHCCLGVLCEVMKTEFSHSSALPSSEILGKAGLSEHDALFLANMNDGTLEEWADATTVDMNRKSKSYRRDGGITFNQTAKWVRENL